MCTLGLEGHPGLNFAIPIEEILGRYRGIKAAFAGEENAPSECPYCAAVNTVAEKYCANCGAELPYYDIDIVPPPSMGSPTGQHGAVAAGEHKCPEEVPVLRQAQQGEIRLLF